MSHNNCGGLYAVCTWIRLLCLSLTKKVFFHDLSQMETDSLPTVCLIFMFIHELITYRGKTFRNESHSIKWLYLLLFSSSAAVKCHLTHLSYTDNYSFYVFSMTYHKFGSIRMLKDIYNDKSLCNFQELKEDLPPGSTLKYNLQTYSLATWNVSFLPIPLLLFSTPHPLGVFLFCTTISSLKTVVHYPFLWTGLLWLVLV